MEVHWTLQALDREIEAYRKHLQMALENGLTSHAEGYARHLDSLQNERQRLLAAANTERQKS